MSRAVGIRNQEIPETDDHGWKSENREIGKAETWEKREKRESEKGQKRKETKGTKAKAERGKSNSGKQLTGSGICNTTVTEPELIAAGSLANVKAERASLGFERVSRG